MHNRAVSEPRFDAVVIGSGFGGSVAALRLAEAGFSVALLERGRWWSADDFPRRKVDLWKARRSRFTPDGLYDVRSFDGVTVYAANGVGGGSLIYSSVLVRPVPAALDALPVALRAVELEPHYRRVLAMLRAMPAPEDAYPKSAHLRGLASRLGEGRWRMLELAVNFEGPRALPMVPGHPNAGRTSEACVGCGHCNLGCHVLAKNTLDLVYLPAAMAAGAKVFAQCEAVRIRPSDGGYRVDARDRTARAPRTFLARRVILAAGAVASTELLLKSRARGDLPRISRALGTRFSVNGDHLTVGYRAAEASDGRRGPIITSGIDLPDPEGRGRDILVEDAGQPELITGTVARLVPRLTIAADRIAASLRGREVSASSVLRAAREALRDLVLPPLDERTLTLCLMARDASDGIAALDRLGRMSVSWRWRGSADIVARANEIILRLDAAARTEIALEPIRPEARAHTVHPLGGCPIGEDAASGVVSARGEVFGHPGIHVLDGSIVPAAVGVNPSLTIAALAEAIVERIVSAR